jgi:hypothetical protein
MYCMLYVLVFNYLIVSKSTQYKPSQGNTVVLSSALRDGNRIRRDGNRIRHTEEADHREHFQLGKHLDSLPPSVIF